MILLQAQSFNTDPGENLLDTFICCGIKLHKATQREAWYLLSMTRQKHLFSEHWHVTYSVTFPFTQGRRCFPNIWIQSGSTTWLCDELLTIVVLALVNRFVNGRVPTAVTENKENYLEIYTYQVSCPLSLPLLNIPNCQSVLKYLPLYCILFIFAWQLYLHIWVHELHIC